MNYVNEWLGTGASRIEPLRVLSLDYPPARLVSFKLANWSDNFLLADPWFPWRLVHLSDELSGNYVLFFKKREGKMREELVLSGVGHKNPD